jgi:hypothetical protein
MTKDGWLPGMLMAACLCGCATSQSTGPARSTTPEKPYLRRLDYSKAPEAKEFAERAERFANEVYPQVCSLLLEDTSRAPPQFDLTFKRRLSGDNRGLTVGSKIYLNAGWFTNNPASLETVLVHELAHVAQAYWWLPWFSTPRYWQEGMADFVRFKLGYTNVLGCPQCSVEFPHYTSGFWCAGAFLLYLDTTYGPTVARRLNADLRRGRYSETVFVETTGKSLSELWTEFQGTAGFTSVAAAVNRLYVDLGYRNGKPPPEVEDRFRKFLEQNGEPTDLRGALGHVTGELPKDVLRRYAVYRYFKGPSGPLEAVGTLQDLLHNGRLPGIAPGGHGQIEFGIPEECHCESYPISQTFAATKQGEGSTYHYTLVQESKGGPWRLARAWRTASSGAAAEEYPTP